MGADRNMRRLLTCLFLVAASTVANAQQLVDGSDPEQLENLIRGFGSAVLETDDVGDPMIVGRMEGTRFVVLFYGCDDAGSNCDSVQFRAAWSTSGEISLDAINAWNRDKRFGKAYIDDENDPVIEMDVNLDSGVTRRSFEDSIDWWQVVLADFKLNVLDE